MYIIKYYLNSIYPCSDDENTTKELRILVRPRLNQFVLIVCFDVFIW